MQGQKRKRLDGEDVKPFCQIHSNILHDIQNRTYEDCVFQPKMQMDERTAALTMLKQLDTNNTPYIVTTDTYRLEYADDVGMKVITARELHKIGIEETAKRIREQVGNVPCIVTFDIGFLDPSAAPGTGNPVSGGFTTYEGTELIRQSLPGLDIKGFDLVEVMEDYDPCHITALAATHIIAQFLAILSVNKKNRK